MILLFYLQICYYSNKFFIHSSSSIELLLNVLRLNSLPPNVIPKLFLLTFILIPQKWWTLVSFSWAPSIEGTIWATAVINSLSYLSTARNFRIQNATEEI